MRGSIRPRGKHSWEVVFDIGRDLSTGKRRQVFRTVKGSKADAQRALRELLHSVEKGDYVKPSRITLGEWLEEWLSGYVDCNCSPRTKASYEYMVRRHVSPKLGSIPLSQLETRHVQAFYSRLRVDGRIKGDSPLSSTTIRYCHTILSEAINHAVKMGLVARNVAQAADLPKPENRAMPTLAPDDVPKFLQFAEETPYFIFFYTLLYTGMRRGEALALKWKNLDPDLATVSVVESGYKLKKEYIIKEPKTPHSRRQIALSPTLAIALRKHREREEAVRLTLGRPLSDQDFVFAHPDGTPLAPDTVTHAFAKILARAGLPHVRLHDLRHTHATIMLRAGVHPKIVSERLGHSSIRITLDTYSHVLPGLQEAAARRFDAFMETKGQTDRCWQHVGKSEEIERGPGGTRTPDLLTASQTLSL